MDLFLSSILQAMEILMINGDHVNMVKTMTNDSAVNNSEVNCYYFAVGILKGQVYPVEHNVAYGSKIRPIP